MPDAPLVSILTTCFDHERYLPACVESVIGQTYPRIELIVVDDCSTDDSWAVLEAYRKRLEQRCERVVLIRQEENQGLLRSFPIAAEEARGEIISVLESDDLYHSEKVEKNVDYLLTNPDFRAVHSDAHEIRQDLDLSRPGFWGRTGRKIPIGWIFHDLLHDNFILNCSFACWTDDFWRHARLSDYDKRGYSTIDYPLFLDLSRGVRFGYLAECLAHYRRVENSVSHGVSAKTGLTWRRNYYRIKLDYCTEFDAPKHLVRRAETQYYQQQLKSSWIARESAEFDEAIQWLRRFYPDRYDRPRYRVRQTTLRINPLWKLVRLVEGRLVHSDLAEYRPFRDVDSAPTIDSTSTGSDA